MRKGAICFDSHQHFWRYEETEYPWIRQGMEVLRRDFLPTDLQKELAAWGISGSIAVQARQTLAETEWLLDLTKSYSFIRGVVGWAPLISPEIDAILERLARHPRLRGIRHVLQDEEDDEYMLRPDFNRGISRLRQYGLAYDILLYERQLPQTLRFVDQHPGQIFVLDHIAKPCIRAGVLEPWRTHMRALAARPHVWCKISGVVTEADHRVWTMADIRPYLETALEAFGPRRLLFGSDWPVCLLASSYARWWETVHQFISPLTADEQEAIMGGNARVAYRLDKTGDEEKR